MNYLPASIVHLSLASILVAQMVVFPGVAARQRPGSDPVTEVARLATSGALDLADPAVRAQMIALRGQFSRSQRQALNLAYYERIIRPLTDLEAFARIAEFSARMTDGSEVEFMRDMSALILDAPGNAAAIAAGPLGRALERLHTRWSWVPGYPSLLRFGSQGFLEDDGGNQVQHFWYSVAIAYAWGGPLADALARYHEWNAPGLLDALPGTAHGSGTALDLRLSRKGIQFGLALAEGKLRTEDAGRWLRENLGR